MVSAKQNYSRCAACQLRTCCVGLGSTLQQSDVGASQGKLHGFRSASDQVLAVSLEGAVSVAPESVAPSVSSTLSSDRTWNNQQEPCSVAISWHDAADAGPAEESDTQELSAAQSMPCRPSIAAAEITPAKAVVAVGRVQLAGAAPPMAQASGDDWVAAKQHSTHDVDDDQVPSGHLFLRNLP